LREDPRITLRVRLSFLRDRSKGRAVTACRTKEVRGVLIGDQIIDTGLLIRDLISDSLVCDYKKKC